MNYQDWTFLAILAVMALIYGSYYFKSARLSIACSSAAFAGIAGLVVWASMPNPPLDPPVGFFSFSRFATASTDPAKALCEKRGFEYLPLAGESYSCLDTSHYPSGLRK